MAKLTLNDFGSAYNSWQKLNSNNTLLETALENTLSRDGTEPNQMEAVLDMNSNRVINVGAPINGPDAARLIDLQNYLSADIPTPSQPGFGTLLVYLSAYATIELADTAAALIGGTLLIDKVYELTQNWSPTCRSIMNGAGSIYLGDFDITFNQTTSYFATRVTSFVFNGTGRVKGTAQFVNPHVEWFGAIPDRSVTSNATANRRAFQYWADYAAQSDWGGITVYALGEYLSDDETVTVVADSAGRLMTFQGQRGQTIYQFNPGSLDTAFVFEGPAGGVSSGGGLLDFVFSSGGSALGNMVCVDLIGVIGTNVRIGVATAAARAVRAINRDTSMFTEFCGIHIFQTVPDCRCVLEYQQVNGDASFHGTGLTSHNGLQSIINFYAGLAPIRITSGTGNAWPYDSPLYATFFSFDNPGGGQLGPAETDAILIQNDNLTNVGLHFYGHLGIEAFNSGTITLAEGAGGDVFFSGTHEFFTDPGRTFRNTGHLTHGVRRGGIGGSTRVDYLPLHNLLSYGTAPKYIFNFPGPTGSSTAWEVDVDIVATDYHYRYVLRYFSNGSAPGTYTIVPGSAIYNLDTATYGAPNFTADSTGIIITNANYNGNGVEIGVVARPIGISFNFAENQ